MKFQQIRGATALLTYAGRRFLIDPAFAPKGAVRPASGSRADLERMAGPLEDLPLPAGEIVAGADAFIITSVHRPDHFDGFAESLLPKDARIFTQSGDHAFELRQRGFTNVSTLTFDGTEHDGIRMFWAEVLPGEGNGFQRKKTGRSAEDRAANGGPAPGGADACCSSAECAACAHGTGSGGDGTCNLLRRMASSDPGFLRGLTAETCGFALEAPGEPRLYSTGDTVLFDGVWTSLACHMPEVIVVSASAATDEGGKPVMMDAGDVLQLADAVPDARIIATGMEGFAYSRLTRAGLRALAAEHGLSDRVLVPENGEAVEL